MSVDGDTAPKQGDDDSFETPNYTDKEFVENISPGQYGDYPKSHVSRLWLERLTDDNGGDGEYVWYDDRGIPVYKIPFEELHVRDGESATEYLWSLQSAVNSLAGHRVETEFVDLPAATINIEDIRAEHLDTLQVVEAQVTNRSDMYGRVVYAGFECTECSQPTFEYQDKFSGKIETPDLRACDCEDCGVYRAEDHDVTITSQETVLQDLHRNASTPDPSDMIGSLDGDLVGEIESGETIKAAVLVRGDVNETRVDFHLQVVAVEHQEEDFQTVEVSQEDLEKIENVAERDDVHDVLADSIAPSLQGDEQYDLARQAVLYQLAGGVRMDLGDEVERGVIHTALVGDPSTGKSQLARAAHRISPKSEYASGENVTEVGFTASIDREERFDNAEWTLRGGVLPRAHRGLAVIDELDKASDKHQEALHTPLSEQQVSVSKVISATLECKTSTLVVANPDGQRFDVRDHIDEQIGIEPALFSRFDLVIPFVDTVNSQVDKQIFDKYKDSNSDDGIETFREGFIRKYISVARDIDPQLSDDAVDYLNANYDEIRQMSSDTRVAITTRHGEGMRRLAQASARLRLSETVTTTDMQRAKDLLMSSLKLIATDEYGNLDADRLGPGDSAEKRELKKEISEIVQVLDEAGETPVAEEPVRELDRPSHQSWQSR